MMAKLLALLAVLLFITLVESKLIYAYSLVRHGAEYPKNDLYDGN